MAPLKPNRLASLLATLLSLALLAPLTRAYNADNKLVDYYDNMLISSSADPLTNVYTTKLYTFPFVEDVSNFGSTI